VKLTGLQQSDYGWLAVLGVVVVAEVTGGSDQMLSHGAARYKAAHPVLTTTIVLTTAFHLLEWLDDEVDPFHRTYELVRRFRRHAIHAATPTRTTAITGT
jgi:hypothetical protein